jgi:hypothetical protein
VLLLQLQILRCAAPMRVLVFFLLKFVMCDCDFYLPQGYTGAAHQNLCSLNDNGGEGGAAHRDILLPTKVTI